MAETGLWKKEIRSGSYKVLAALPFLVIFGLFIVFSHDMITGLVERVSLPDIFKGEVEKLQDYQYYIWSQWFGKNFYQIGTIFAMIFGAGLISSEVSRKTIHFLLTKPISRTNVFTIKYIVSLVALILTGVISTLLLYLFVLADGKGIDPGLLAQNTLMASAGFTVIYSCAVWFSTIFDRSIKSAAALGGIVLLVSIPGFFPKLGQYSLFYQMQGVEIVTGQGFPFVPFLIMLLASGAFYLLGRTRFARLDF